MKRISENIAIVSSREDPFVQTQDERPQTLPLGGKRLSPRDLARASVGPVTPLIDPAQWQRVEMAHRVLLAAAAQGQKIYGLTTGVGANRDQAALQAEDLFDVFGKLTKAANAQSEAFNQALLHTHGAGVGTPAASEIVRTAMIVRLNTVLSGGSGMSLATAQGIANMLARDVMPVIPHRGSVGAADISLLSHMGLVMAGHWYAHAGEDIIPGDLALKNAGLKPIRFVAKDALAIFNSNAYSAALAIHALEELTQIRDMCVPIFALSLEAFNGNVAPLMEEPSDMRPFPFVHNMAQVLRGMLTGSYLFAPCAARALQDPLSYRTAIYQIGAFDRALNELHNLLEIQINGADDNPVVSLGEVSAQTTALAGIQVVDREGLTGAVVPSASFSSLPQTIALQTVAIALAHVSEGILKRTIALTDPDMSGLSRFLTGPKGIHGFGALHKPISAIASENRELANPVSLDFETIALGFEDMATNAPRVARRLRRMCRNLTMLLGCELMLSAQALDLRLEDNPDLALSPDTRNLHAEYRKKVQFLRADTFVLSDLIERSTDFVASCRLLGDHFEAPREAHRKF
ncbi:MAG: aromatic amino acid ammonia-lyase [Pseudomonadota bacterium]